MEYVYVCNHNNSHHVLHVFIFTIYLTSAKKLTSQQITRRQLLTKFEESLKSLKEIPLHPQIKEAIYHFYIHYTTTMEQGVGVNSNGNRSRAGSIGSGSSGMDVTGSGDHSNHSNYLYHIFQSNNIDDINTLYECIPLEREKKFLSECNVNHNKVL